MDQMTKTKTKASQGIYFDLAYIFNDLNKRFFACRINASLSWGQRNTRARKRSIRFGSYNPNTKSIIINPCLDQAIVPYICVERIMFHEMLHQQFPAKKGAHGKLMVHYREFYEYEKTYPYLKEADQWLKANLSDLLRY